VAKDPRPRCTARAAAALGAHLRRLRHAARPADEAATGPWCRAALLAGQHEGPALVCVLLALPWENQAVVPAAVG